MHERLTGVILSAALHLGVVSFGAIALSHAEAAAPSPPRTSLTYVTMRSASPFVASGTTAASVLRAAPVPRPAFTPTTLPPEEPADIPPADMVTQPSIASDVAELSAAEPARLEVAAAPVAVEDVPKPAAPPVRVGAFDRARAPQAAAQGRGAVTPAGFTSVEATRVDVAADGAPLRVGTLQNDQIDVPAEIVFKPEPRYTDEAQALGIEGTVVLEVEFSASNGVRVLRTVRGLGHGLDEAAARAAEQIRFKPARRGGVAVDCRVTVRIDFRLT